MQFVSKNSNLRIVLKPGLPANPMIGVPATTGIHVKFNNGIVDVKDEEHIKMMLAHPGFNADFIAVNEQGQDPFAYGREEIEPVHVIQQIKYGHVDGAMRSERPVKISPELQAFIDAKAMETARKMVPGMVDDILTKFAEEAKAKQEQATREAALEAAKNPAPISQVFTEPAPEADSETEDLRETLVAKELPEETEAAPKRSIMEILGKSKK